MATRVSLFFSIEPQPHSYPSIPFRPHQSPFLTSKFTYPFPTFPKSNRLNLTLSLSTSHSSSSSSTLQDPLRTGRFLTNEELEKLQFLENFRYYQKLKSGSMWVRVMKEDEMDMTVSLLSESFAEAMLLSMGYVNLLGFLVKQYLIERRTLMPHTATLIGFYREDDDDDDDDDDDGEEDDVQLAGTVEVSFNKRGSNASPPTPTPPRNSPYVCNMTVNKHLRRTKRVFENAQNRAKYNPSPIFYKNLVLRGIGWHLLKASEELISQMSFSREVYLHCRMIDEAPFNMYTKAGYSIVKTDSILVLLMLQRRKHLMSKKLLILNTPSEMDVSDSDEELPSQVDM